MWISLIWKFTQQPVRFHLRRPEAKHFLDTASDVIEKYPWKRGKRHFLAGGGKKGKGTFLNCAGRNCLVDAWLNPQDFGFNEAPDTALAKRVQTDIFLGTSGWVEENFHLVKGQSETTVDDQGKPREYVNRELCQGRECDRCKEGVKKAFGKRSLFVFSRAQWKAVIEPLMEKGEHKCHCGGVILYTHYKCEKCETTLFDVANACPTCRGDNVQINSDTFQAECGGCGVQWELLECNDPNLRDAVSSETKCRECGHLGYAAPNVICSTDGCKGNPLSIFDLQIRIKKEGEGKQAKLVVLDWKPAEPDARLFNIEGQGGGEIGAAIVKRNQEDTDLDKAFEPDSPSDQAKEIGKRNLFATDTNAVSTEGGVRPQQTEAYEGN